MATRKTWMVRPAPATLPARRLTAASYDPKQSRTSDAETAIKENTKEGDYAKGAPRIMGKLRDLIVKIAGDTRQFTTSVTTPICKLTVSDSRGVIWVSMIQLAIILFLMLTPLSMSTALHEVFHAATANST